MQPGHDCGAGGIAAGGRAVVAGEGDRLLGKAVEVGRDGLGVSAERLDPIVEVVDGDEEDVGLLCSCLETGREGEVGRGD